jgi:tetratricopeptide (TPR) repeat protein
VQLWLRGLQWDPSDLEAVRSLMQAAGEYMNASGKKAASKDIGKVASDARGAVRRYLSELTTVAFKPADLVANLKAGEAAGGVQAEGVAGFFGERALTLAKREKKPRKDVFVRLMDVFNTARSFKLAVEAGVIAQQLDPSDGALQAEVRNMMAQQTMASGGFDQVGQEGGFRKNIRNVARQADLEAADRMVRTDDEKDRLVVAAEKEYQEKPGDAVAIDTYGKRLIERGKAGDHLRAMTVYNAAYEATRQFRFRQKAGDIQIQLARRSLAHAKQVAEKRPDDADATAKLESLQKELDRIELAELELRVQNYPTDLALKFALGKKLFDVGRFDDSIHYFQEAQDDQKARASVLYYMGRAFLSLTGWEAEAISTLRRAIAEVSDERGELALELRYYLMAALLTKAKRDRERASAEEADELAAGIAMQKFNYRDIREQRANIKQLLEELKD